MVTLPAQIDSAMRRLGSPHADARALQWRLLAAALLIAGPVYGAVMGSFALDQAARLLMTLYAALKVPILLLGTTVVCLPGFFVLNSVLGLRRDFAEAIAAILTGQAVMAVCLASLAPLTALAYVSGADYRLALIFNTLMFALAAAIGQVVLFRRYRILVKRDRRHALMLWTWLALYAFVGIQMGWTLRPFIGNPDVPVTFFRPDPFTNAYMELIHIVFRR